MAKLTLDRFIDYFKDNEYVPTKLSVSGKEYEITDNMPEETKQDLTKKIKSEVASQLKGINLGEDVFIKNVDDSVFIEEVRRKVLMDIKDYDSKFNFITWVENKRGKKTTFSFWLFPVFVYQNNTQFDLLRNVVSIVQFRKTLTQICLADDLPQKIKVYVVGEYPKELVNVSSYESSKISSMKRQASLIQEKLKALHGEDEPCSIEVTLISHQFERAIKEDADILILPNGHIGNAIYRAWFSSGLTNEKHLRHASMVIHRKTHLPLWVGRSIHDPENKLEYNFAQALYGLKKVLVKSEPKPSRKSAPSIKDQTAFGMTLNEFINFFSKGCDSYQPPVVGVKDGKRLEEYYETIKDDVADIVKTNLEKITLKDNVFLKNVPDQFLVSNVKPKIKDEYNDDELQFFTWVELDDHKGRQFSFWFFPVVSFQNNTTNELIDNTLSVIDFGILVRNLYKEPRYQESYGPCDQEGDKKCSDCNNKANVRVTLVGYPDSFIDNDKSEYLKHLERKTEIIVDNIEEDREVTVNGIPIKRICVNKCDNRFEQHLGNTDLLVFQNGEIGNAIYRAWISTGFVKNSFTFVIHKKTKEPLWVGKSTFDPAKDEESFARACYGLKLRIQNHEKP